MNNDSIVKIIEKCGFQTPVKSKVWGFALKQIVKLTEMGREEMLELKNTHYGTHKGEYVPFGDKLKAGRFAKIQANANGKVNYDSELLDLNTCDPMYDGQFVR